MLWILESKSGEKTVMEWRKEKRMHAALSCCHEGLCLCCRERPGTGGVMDWQVGKQIR
jgi:hypothetical protein